MPLLSGGDRTKDSCFKKKNKEKLKGNGDNAGNFIFISVWQP